MCLLAVSQGAASESHATQGQAHACDLTEQCRMPQGRKNHCVAVIGDGAITGGMAYEAMNHAGFLDKNMIVVLNDNQQVYRLAGMLGYAGGCGFLTARALGEQFGPALQRQPACCLCWCWRRGLCGARSLLPMHLDALTASLHYMVCYVLAVIIYVQCCAGNAACAGQRHESGPSGHTVEHPGASPRF